LGYDGHPLLKGLFNSDVSLLTLAQVDLDSANPSTTTLVILSLKDTLKFFFLSGDVSSGDAICGRFIYKLGEIGWSEAPV